jgi:electron transport complex protein RnfD
MGIVLLALAPSLLRLVAVNGSGFALRLLWMVAMATALESALLRLRGKSPVRHLADLSAPLTAMLLAFILPASLPGWISCLSLLAAIGLGKQAFGGLGDNPFNPAMVGYALVLVAFPEWFTDIVGSAPWTSSALLAAGAALMLVTRTINWQGPTAFLGTSGFIYLAAQALSASPSAGWRLPALPELLFAAFFIVTDPVTGCLSGRGRALFGMGAGALLVLLSGNGHVASGLPFAILLMNVAAPWIDGRTRPVPIAVAPAGIVP